MNFSNSAAGSGLQDVILRLTRIEEALQSILHAKTIKEWYSTTEVAELVQRAEFTVREWCRRGRIHAQKKKTGRGPVCEWMISHEELTRIQNHGIAPVKPTNR